LSLVHCRYCLDCFDFNDDALEDQQVNAVGQIHHQPIISDWQRKLPIVSNLQREDARRRGEAAAGVPIGI